MWNDFLRVVHFKIHFLICSWSDHSNISMAYATIDAIYAGSLTLKISYFFFE